MKEGEAKEEFNNRLQKLEILESVLHQYQEPQFKIMGNILLEIQRHKMYLLRGCKNLREYVLKHHTFQWRSARRYMNAVRVMDFLADVHRVLPTSEKQVRCLALCTQEEVNAIWAKAVESAEGQCVQITANLVKSIKCQICQEVDPKQSSRGPRPWQDEYMTAGSKHRPNHYNGEHQDSSWEFADSSSDDDGDSDEGMVHFALKRTDLKLKWGRKRSRYHGYARMDGCSIQSKTADPQTPALEAPVSLSAMLAASLQPLTPPVHPPVSGHSQCNPAMSYPSIPLPPAGPLAMSDVPNVSGVEAATTAAAAGGTGISMPTPLPAPNVNTLGAPAIPGVYIPGTPGVEAAALDLISMRQGVTGAVPAVNHTTTNAMPIPDLVALGDNCNGAGTSSGC